MRKIVAASLLGLSLVACSQNDRSDRSDRGERRETAGRRAGGGNREARFERLDANNDGTLETNEMRPRMQQRLNRLDTDGDGKISKDEFTSRNR
jgi:hypothetical protein